MSALKTFIVRMSDGHEIRLQAFQQLGTPATPYFVDEKQDTVAGFGTVLGWWSEQAEVKVEAKAVDEV